MTLYKIAIFLAAAVTSANLFAETVQSKHAKVAARETLTITVTSERTDGSRVVETRVVDLFQATAMGLIGPGNASVVQANGPQPPVQPHPPMSGAVPNDTTRVDIHQENDYYERDTTFTRVPGGPWFISNDSLKSTRPAKCYTHPPECDTLPQ